VQAVAGVNNNTIVVVNSVGPIILEAWVNNPNVTALVSGHTAVFAAFTIHHVIPGLERFTRSRSR
jgi:hypothetical protein